MLKDITIGQHFPGHSILHRCDPRLKLVATIAYIIVLFVAPNPLGLALSIALLAALYKIAQIPGKMILNIHIAFPIFRFHVLGLFLSRYCLTPKHSQSLIHLIQTHSFFSLFQFSYK